MNAKHFLILGALHFRIVCLNVSVAAGFASVCSLFTCAYCFVSIRQLYIYICAYYYKYFKDSLVAFVVINKLKLP